MRRHRRRAAKVLAPEKIHDPTVVFTTEAAEENIFCSVTVRTTNVQENVFQGKKIFFRLLSKICGLFPGLAPAN